MSRKRSARKLSIVQTVVSVLAAFVGVQSRKNRVRDFNHGESRHFIAVGVFLTLLFVVILILIVSQMV